MEPPAFATGVSRWKASSLDSSSMVTTSFSDGCTGFCASCIGSAGADAVVEDAVVMTRGDAVADGFQMRMSELKDTVLLVFLLDESSRRALFRSELLLLLALLLLMLLALLPNLGHPNFCI